MTPKIDPRVLTRPKLDALFERHAHGEVDDDGLHAGVQALSAEVGLPPVLDALVKRMEGTPEAERETLMRLVEWLRAPEVIQYLWQQVKKPGALSVEAKVTALVILKQMGEEVDLTDPGRYFSPRDFKPGNIKSAEDLFRQGMRGIARHLREARDAVEVERLMLDINRMPETAIDGDNILLDFVQNAEAEANDLGADFLCALAHATPYPKVQQAAAEALRRLAARGIHPVTPVILSLGEDKFHAAYMTDPQHPWQQNVQVAWERAGGEVQVLSFLLDFGVPWRGAIKDMFATQSLTPETYYRRFVERGEKKMGEHFYHVRLARAQATIAAAVEANRQNKVPLPKEFTELRHLVERWVLHPPAAALEADATQDELDDAPLLPNYDDKPLVLDLRGQRGRQIMQILAGHESDEAGEDDLWEDEAEQEVAAWEADDTEFYDFDDILEDVAAFHADFESAPWWKAEWLRDYLTSLTPNPEDLERFDEGLELIADHWIWLKDFFEYQDEYGYDVRTLSDLRGFHFSEYWAAEADLDDDGGRSRLEIFRDFFNYLARQDIVSAQMPALVELQQMLAQPDRIVPLERPQPLGGEVAVWPREFSDAGEAAPLTYNEWWLALVLEKKFKFDWEKLRRAATKKPDGEAKIVVLHQLESRLDDHPDYLEYLDNDRWPEPKDHARAQQWFDREPVNTSRAW